MILNNAENIYVDDNPALRVFADGEMVWGLPKGYKRCKYLESSGKQFVLTAYFPSNRTQIVTTITDIGSKTATYFFGACRTYNEDVVTLSYNPRYDNLYRIFFGKKTNELGSAIIGSSRINGLVKMLDGSALINGIWVEYASTGEFTAPASLSLFVRNSPSGLSNMAIARIGSFRCCENNTTKLNLLPALDSQGSPCMYDTISKRSFYNNGTGEFGYELLDGTYVTPV